MTTIFHRRLLAVLGLTLFGFGVPSSAHAAVGDAPLSPEMRQIAVDEMRGVKLDGGLQFRDHTGATTTLSRYFEDGKPVLLTLNYYRCRVICSVQLNGLADALSALDWTAGDHDYRIVTVSIDPRETPADAADKRKRMLDAVGKGEDLDWSFLVGDTLQVRALAAQLGIAYQYDAEQDQYAHPAVAVFVAPGGTVTQYLYGLTYEPRDLKFALMEASEGKLGTPVEQLLMSCFHYDATIGRYGPWAFGIMRLGGTLTLAALGATLIVLWRRERRRLPSPAESNAEAVS